MGIRDAVVSRSRNCQHRLAHGSFRFIGGTHGDINRWELGGGRAGATNPHGAVFVHRQGWNQVVAIGIDNEAFLQRRTIADPQFAPNDPPR